jgi:hypothetical protein
MNVKKQNSKAWTESAGSGEVPVAAFCEHNHGPSGSIQVRISRQTLLHGVGSIP